MNYTALAFLNTCIHFIDVKDQTFAPASINYKHLINHRLLARISQECTSTVQVTAKKFLIT